MNNLWGKSYAERVLDVSDEFGYMMTKKATLRTGISLIVSSANNSEKKIDSVSSKESFV